MECDTEWKGSDAAVQLFIMCVTQLWTAVGEYHCLSVTAVVLIGVFCLLFWLRYAAHGI